MADIATIALQALYRTTPTAIPLFSTQNWPTQTVNAAHGETNRIFAPAASLYTRSFSHYATIDSVAIFNLHATNQLEVSHNDGFGHLNTQRVLAGRLYVIPSVNVATNIVFQGIGAIVPVLFVVIGT